MSGPISLTLGSKKKSLKGFMRTNHLKLGHVPQWKLVALLSTLNIDISFLYDIYIKCNIKQDISYTKTFTYSKIKLEDLNSKVQCWLVSNKGHTPTTAPALTSRVRERRTKWGFTECLTDGAKRKATYLNQRFCD